MAAARLPHAQRDGRPHRPARDDARRSTTGRRRGSTSRSILYQPDVRAERRPLLPDQAQDHGLEKSLDKTTLLDAVPAGARARRAGRGDAADPQRQPRRRHDRSAARSRAATAPSGLPDDTIQLHFQGSAGPELRRVRAARHHADAGRRRQRLRRQGAVGRQDHRLPAAQARRSCAEENVIIGNVALLRRDRRRGLHPRHGGRALLRPQQRRQRGRRGRGRPRLRVHDRRPRRRARADGPQLRGRHVGRHRLRARRGRRLRAHAATRRWCSSTPLEDPRRSSCVQADAAQPRRATPAATRAAGDAARLGRASCRSS